jgi:ribosomal protein S27AE
MQAIDEGGERRIEQCGTVLARLKLAQCESCGKYFAPEKYIEHINKVADADKPVKLERKICPECAREIKAVAMAGYAKAFRADH